VSLSVHHLGWGTSKGPVVIDVATINGLASSSYQTWAFKRAELTAFVGSPFRLPNGNPLGFARVRQLDPRLIGVERLESLAKRALVGVWSTLGRLIQQAQFGVVLCLPERMEHDERDRRIRRRLESFIVGPLLQQGYQIQVRTLTSGHASLAYALAETGDLMRDYKLDCALVLGVDSYYDPHVLERLFDEQRVLDSDWRDAFVPGEAATAVVVVRPDVARELALSPLAHIDSVATNQESATRTNAAPMLGHGLSRPAVAITKKMRDENQRLEWWIADVTGETFRLQEWQLAWPRAARLAMTSQDRFDFLPTHLGEIGAATMHTALAIAVEGMRRGDPRAHYCLLSGSSDGGSRGVVLLRRPRSHAEAA
jgi:3-oxoacyl-[acyl-carrier-protein] synthase-1